jgi:8-oxo-dGTP diphosphatase
MHYVVGFQFNFAGNRVALVRKLRPSAQFGLLNGVGGHVERGETSRAAVRREFREEAGLDQPETLWKHFASLRTHTENLVSFFSSFTDEVEKVRTVTDEVVGVYDVAVVTTYRRQNVSNLLWLLYMALSMRGAERGGDGRESAGLLAVMEVP